MTIKEITDIFRQLREKQQELGLKPVCWVIAPHQGKDPRSEPIKRWMHKKLRKILRSHDMRNTRVRGVIRKPYIPQQ